MPDIGAFHPQIIHFVIVLGIVGVILRLVSFTPFFTWSREAAMPFLVAAAVAGVVAAKSGDDAHDVPERIPGVREAVHDHEESGELARNILLGIALLEVGAFALRKKEKVARGLLMASGLAGIAAFWAIYEAGEHGGEVVYEYAGGIGTRSGEAEDVQNLLVAGLYNQARVARDSGRLDEAARLTEELARQRPDDANVKFLLVESQLKDRKDAAGALAAAAALQGDPENPFFAMRRGLLMSDAYVALGHADSAKMVLTMLAERFPESRTIKGALEKLP
ncbi:MAG: hypothetical protein E4H38_04345 [Gemmatimonadales bacterium]|nr:MAG: hypothetical protein E4H38_04345 [Gemmatimonadales bacterium]